MNQFSEKMDNSEFLGPDLPKNGFWGQIFKNLSLDLESRPKDLKTKIPCVTIFCQSLYLGKLPNYVQYFGSNIVEGVAESWVEAEMSLLEVDGAGWRWMELSGGGCVV